MGWGVDWASDIRNVTTFKSRLYRSVREARLTINRHMVREYVAYSGGAVLRSRVMMSATTMTTTTKETAQNPKKTFSSTLPNRSSHIFTDDEANAQ